MATTTTKPPPAPATPSPAGEVSEVELSEAGSPDVGSQSSGSGGSGSGRSTAGSSGWVYHLGVNSIGHEYRHLRFLVIRGKTVAMYKRDPSKNPGIVGFRSLLPPLLPLAAFRLWIACACVVEFYYVLRFYNRLDQTKKGEKGDNQHLYFQCGLGKLLNLLVLLQLFVSSIFLRTNVLRGVCPEKLLRQSSDLQSLEIINTNFGGDSGDAFEAHEWRYVRTFNGIRIFEDIANAKGGKGVLLKSVGVVGANPDTVFEVVLSLDKHKRCEWDMLTADLELVETIDGYYDVALKAMQEALSKQDSTIESLHLELDSGPAMMAIERLSVAALKAMQEARLLESLCLELDSGLAMMSASIERLAAVRSVGVLLVRDTKVHSSLAKRLEKVPEAVEEMAKKSSRVLVRRVPGEEAGEGARDGGDGQEVIKGPGAASCEPDTGELPGVCEQALTHFPRPVAPEGRVGVAAGAEVDVATAMQEALSKQDSTIELRRLELDYGLAMMFTSIVRLSAAVRLVEVLLVRDTKVHSWLAKRMEKVPEAVDEMAKKSRDLARKPSKRDSTIESLRLELDSGPAMMSASIERLPVVVRSVRVLQVWDTKVHSSLAWRLEKVPKAVEIAKKWSQDLPRRAANRILALEAMQEALNKRDLTVESLRLELDSGPAMISASIERLSTAVRSVGVLLVWDTNVHSSLARRLEKVPEAVEEMAKKLSRDFVWRVANRILAVEEMAKKSRDLAWHAANRILVSYRACGSRPCPTSPATTCLEDVPRGRVEVAAGAEGDVATAQALEATQEALSKRDSTIESLRLEFDSGPVLMSASIERLSAAVHSSLARRMEKVPESVEMAKKSRVLARRAANQILAIDEMQEAPRLELDSGPTMMLASIVHLSAAVRSVEVILVRDTKVHSRLAKRMEKVPEAVDEMAKKSSRDLARRLARARGSRLPNFPRPDAPGGHVEVAVGAEGDVATAQRLNAMQEALSKQDSTIESLRLELDSGLAMMSTSIERLPVVVRSAGVLLVWDTKVHSSMGRRLEKVPESVEEMAKKARDLSRRAANRILVSYRARGSRPRPTSPARWTRGGRREGRAGRGDGVGSRGDAGSPEQAGFDHRVPTPRARLRPSDDVSLHRALVGGGSPEQAGFDHRVPTLSDSGPAMMSSSIERLSAAVRSVRVLLVQDTKVHSRLAKRLEKVPDAVDEMAKKSSRDLVRRVALEAMREALSKRDSTIESLRLELSSGPAMMSASIERLSAAVRSVGVLLVQDTEIHLSVAKKLEKTLPHFSRPDAPGGRVEVAAGVEGDVATVRALKAMQEALSKRDSTIESLRLELDSGSAMISASIE
uniref:Uncharacterized protein n=1 Tax=Leersia perrieri TaxID=77586 RepID=A0A0D9X892_9ORYZ